MRHSKTIPVGDKPVVVLEVSVAQLGDLVAVLGLIPTSMTAMGLLALAQTVFGSDDGPARRLLHGATDQGVSIDDFGGLALLDIADAWVEVNQPFFDRLTALPAKLLASPDPAAPAGGADLPPEAVEQAA